MEEERREEERGKELLRRSRTHTRARKNNEQLQREWNASSEKGSTGVGDVIRRSLLLLVVP
jgi:hypothetical protein